jgi:hypothetical protein
MHEVAFQRFLQRRRRVRDGVKALAAQRAMHRATFWRRCRARCRR